MLISQNTSTRNLSHKKLSFKETTFDDEKINKLPDKEKAVAKGALSPKTRAKIQELTMGNKVTISTFEKIYRKIEGNPIPHWQYKAEDIYGSDYNFEISFNSTNGTPQKTVSISLMHPQYDRPYNCTPDMVLKKITETTKIPNLQSNLDQLGEVRNQIGKLKKEEAEIMKNIGIER